MARPSRLYVWDPEDPDEFDPEQGATPSYFDPRDENERARIVSDMAEEGFETGDAPPEPMGALANARSAELGHTADLLQRENPYEQEEAPAPVPLGAQAQAIQDAQAAEEAAISRPPPGAGPSALAESQDEPLQTENEPELSPWAQLAKFRRERGPSTYAKVEGPNKALYGVGAALDVLLNKGRGLGTLTGLAARPDNSAAENADRAMAAEAHDMRMAQALQPKRASNDPYTNWLRNKNLELRQAQEARMGQQAAARASQQAAEQARIAALRDPGSQETQSWRDSAIAADPNNASVVANMTGEQIQAWRPQLGQMAHSLQSNDEWRRRFSMQQQADLAKEGRAAEAKLGEEGRAAERQEGTRAEDFADKYATKYDKDLAIAGLIQDIDAAGGAAPQSFAERFQGTIAARGIDPSRLEAWRAKQLVLEEWGRKQSQGAIGLEEADRLTIQTALQPTASPEEVNAAYGVLKRHVRRYIRMGAVANPAAARTVTQAAGLDNTWLDGIGDANPKRGQSGGGKAKRPRATPAAAPAPDADGISWD